MTVEELIGRLQDYSGDAQVRLAFQPNWPFEYSIGEIVGSGDLESYEALKDDDGWYVERHGEQFEGPFETVEEAQAAIVSKEAEEAEEVGNVVWIGERSQLGYLPGVASHALGWR